MVIQVFHGGSVSEMRDWEKHVIDDQTDGGLVRFAPHPFGKLEQPRQIRSINDPLSLNIGLNRDRPVMKYYTSFRLVYAGKSMKRGCAAEQVRKQIARSLGPLILVAKRILLLVMARDEQDDQVLWSFRLDGADDGIKLRKQMGLPMLGHGLSNEKGKR
jgi:hypothetical protein